MRLEEGCPVVLADAVSPTLIHLPARTRRRRTGRYAVARELEAELRRGIIGPWPAECGLEGDVWALDGVVRARLRNGSRVCSVCRARR